MGDRFVDLPVTLNKLPDTDTVAQNTVRTADNCCAELRVAKLQSC
jgi:hypothetical protein